MKVAWLIFLFASVLEAKGVLAGTTITNVAQLRYEMNGNVYHTTSNTHTDIVDHLIELSVVCQSSESIKLRKGQNEAVVPLRLVNTGNAKDTFSLMYESNITTLDVENPLIYLDDGDGVFAKSSDVLVQDVNLSADEEVTLFLVMDIPAQAEWKTGSFGIEARSQTGGSSVAGTVYDLGSYRAVDGFKGGVDKALCAVVVDELNLKLEKKAHYKTQGVYKGTVITYAITAHIEGFGKLENVEIIDPLPEGVEYVVGSLRLNGNALKDATHYDGKRIRVALGDMERSSTMDTVHVIEFSVKIK